MYLNGGVYAGMIIKLPPGGVKDRRVHKDIQTQEGGLFRREKGAEAVTSVGQ